MSLLSRSTLTTLAVALLAGCVDSDPVRPLAGTRFHSAQGDNGVWTVNVLTDPGDGVCDDASCTLREAIASAGTDDQVVFANGLQGTITVSTELLINKDLSVDGGGRITIDGAGQTRLLHVVRTAEDFFPTVALTGLKFVRGNAANAAGILVDNGSVTLLNSTISGNVANAEDGGGVYARSATQLTLTNSIVLGNLATRDGGGIWSEGNLVIVNSTISGNVSLASGGGIFIQDGSVTLRQSTISGNSATTGGGISNGHSGGFVTPPGGNLHISNSTITANSTGLVQGGLGHHSTMSNTILAGNVGASCLDLSGGLMSVGYNIVDGCASLFDAVRDQIVLSSQVFAKVLEPDLVDNGGPTKTHALITRGLAVDAGYCPGETADQRGSTRPVDHPSMPNALDGCDIGAVEAQGPQVAVADLLVSQSVDKAAAKQGDLVTYSVRVQNLGPDVAPNVVLSNVLSSGVSFVEARHNKGSVTAPPNGETGTVSWHLGDLAVQGNEVIEIKVTVRVKGKTTVTNTASVTGDVSDPNPGNNSAALTVTVDAGKAGGPKK